MQAADVIAEAESRTERPKRVAADQAVEMATAVHKAADQLEDPI